MAIHITDLPPAYQTQALEKLGEVQQRRKTSCPAAHPSQAKAPKFRNQKDTRITENGVTVTFDSQKEARRFDALICIQHAGEVRDLRLQVDFTLQEAYTTSGGARVRAIRYKADFTYWERDGDTWRYVVEDVKSGATKTKEYIIKKKLMADKLGISIRET